MDRTIEYLKGKLATEPLDELKWVEVCGIGIVVSPKEITAAVKSYIDSKLNFFKTDRYAHDKGDCLEGIRKIC